MTRGGARAGAGRPRKSSGRITFRCPEWLMVCLDKEPDKSKAIVRILSMFYDSDR